MSQPFLFRLVIAVLGLSGLAAAECVAFTDAAKHVGETRCISGTVLRVEQGSRGIHYLTFCEDYRICPFTVVIFPSDLKHVGDVRQLQGRQIEIHGPVKLYDGRAEIILREFRQLSGDFAWIPPLPKNYDVEKKGMFSAGKFSYPKAGKKTSKKRQPVKLPAEIPEEDTP